MKRIIISILFCFTALLLFCSCPELFKDVEAATIDNQSDFTINVFVDNEYKSMVTPGNTYAFSLYTEQEYFLECRSDPHQWGPIEVTLEKGEPFTWIIENPTEGNIIINNNSTYNNVTIIIGGIIVDYLNTEEFGIYSKYIGNYNLIAICNEGSWQKNIDLTEDGYEWNLETNTELYPSENCWVWNFENNYEDHLGVDNWFKNRTPIFSSNIKKFNSYSLTTEDSDHASIQFFNIGEINKSQNFGLWFYGNITNGEDNAEHQYSLIQIKTPAGASVYCYIRACIRKENLSNDMRVILQLRKNEDESEITLTDTEIITPETWHYIAMSYDINNDRVYLIVNDRIISSDVLGGTWYSYDNFDCLLSMINNYYISDFDHYWWFYIDEAIYCPDQFIDPQVYVDHYNHNAPWGEEYIPE